MALTASGDESANCCDTRPGIRTEHRSVERVARPAFGQPHHSAERQRFDHTTVAVGDLDKLPVEHPALAKQVRQNVTCTLPCLSPRGRDVGNHRPSSSAYSWSPSRI